MEIVRLLSLGEDEATSTIIHLNASTSLLLDCGLGPKMGPLKIERLLKEVASVDIILLSHASMEFLGALTLLSKRGLLD